MKKIFLSICLIALIISPAHAVISTGAVGVTSIDLTDAGAGPGVTGIAKSVHSYVVYSGLASAGFGSGAVGQVMGVIAYSNKAIPAVQLTFGVRASNDIAVADDNSIYQLPSDGTAMGTSDADGYVADGTMAGWMRRGGS